jgi:hypothetical protein
MKAVISFLWAEALSRKRLFLKELALNGSGFRAFSEYT